MRGQTAGPTRRGVAVATGLVVIAAVAAAPQFALPPAVLIVAVGAGGVLGATLGALSKRYRPSRSFLLLAAPLVFVAIAVLPDATRLSRPAILVGLSAVAVGGTLADRWVRSR